MSEYNTRLAQFSVNGIPKGQPRVRAFAGKNGKAGVFDPGTADGWKHLVVYAAEPHRPKNMIEGPVAISVIFLMPRPQWLCKKKTLSLHLVPCTAKPDLDNAIKAMMDALKQAGWFKDDAQVQCLFIEKYYADLGTPPGANVRIQWNTDGSPTRIRTEADRRV